jgi:transmembrane sensor
MGKREASAEIDAVAADWAARIDNASLAFEEQAALEQWLAGDTRRLGAYARARAMFAHARRAKALGPDFDPGRFVRSQAVQGGTFDETPGAAAPIGGPSRRRFLMVGGSAAAAASLIGIGRSWQAAAHTYSTRRGEVRLVPLEDGSLVTLNTDSTASAHFGEEERLVDLLGGEALFDVAPDRARPFVAAAGTTHVRAIGTSFSVQRLANAPVRVMVRTGTVELIGPATAAAAKPQRLTANMRAIAPETAALSTERMPPAEIGRALAWREGMLAFEDMPLAEAAAEFARYSDTRIAFADPAIGKETVTGLYAANNPAGFAKAVAGTLDLQLVQTPGGILLRRPEGPT